MCVLVLMIDDIFLQRFGRVLPVGVGVVDCVEVLHGRALVPDVSLSHAALAVLNPHLFKRSAYK